MTAIVDLVIMWGDFWKRPFQQRALVQVILYESEIG